MTLVGLCMPALSFLLVCLHDTSFREELPTYVYFIAGTSVFLYQTFDACDGKQARRTGTSSPLGQLFDHGCDAMAVTFAVGIYFSATLSG